MFLKIPRQPARTERPVTRIAPKALEESTTAGFYKWLFAGPASLRPVVGRWTVGTVDHITPAVSRPLEGRTIDMAQKQESPRTINPLSILPAFGKRVIAKRPSGLLRFK